MISRTVPLPANDAARGAEPQTPSPPRDDRLLLPNLLNDLGSITGLLAEEVARGSVLDAFLLACGANQIAEDALHESELSLRRVAQHVERVVRGPAGSAAAGAIRAADSARWKARTAPWADRRLAAWQRHAAALVEALARALVTARNASDVQALSPSARALAASCERLPTRVRRAVVRLPSSFRNFDQHPDDVAALTERFAARWPERSRALVVVGVRTSGSYTAPLHAAGLRAMGFTEVATVTFRPGQRWRPDELRTLAAARNAGGLALLTDDPPKSGGSLLKAVRELRERGFADDAIVLLIQTLEGAVVPGALRGLPAEVLEWPAWSIQARLEPEAVSSSLAAMLAPDVEVISAERRPLRARATARSHERALFRVAYRRRGSAAPEEMDVLVKGVGLGYLGAHAEAVSHALAGRIPAVLGVRDGLLYRRWLPDASRVCELGPERAADVVDYSLTRAARLAVDEDMSLRLLDRGAVWQRAGDILARVFGRGAQFSRPLVYPLARALLRTPAPSVIDGRMEPDRWFESETGTLLKVDTDESGFSSLDIHCYDAIFDLASWDGQALGRAVRDDYARRTGRPIEPERWLLYRLVHLSELRRDQSKADPATERAFARELQRYYGDTLLAGLEPAGQGGICAIDVDWTLEGRGLGFPGTTPAGALALRALAGHGFRTVLATGRSLDELRERCDSYRLAGGVAEYGAWTYDHRTRHARRQLSVQQDVALDRLRSVLETISGVEVDPTYQGAIRAYSFTANGARIGLAPETVREALESAAVAGQVRAIPGALQTDFMANGVDKGTGIQALARQLGVDLDAAGGKPLELAVGDSAEDLPMMRFARVAAAPARAALRDQPAGVRFMREPGPMALAEAAQILIGHRPGDCARCRIAPVSDDSRLLLDFLATQDVRRVARPAHALRLISAIRRRGATID